MSLNKKIQYIAMNIKSDELLKIHATMINEVSLKITPGDVIYLFKITDIYSRFQLI